MGKNKSKIKGKFCGNCKYYNKEGKEGICKLLTSIDRFKDKVYVNPYNSCGHFTRKDSKIYYHGS